MKINTEDPGVFETSLPVDRAQVLLDFISEGEFEDIDDFIVALDETQGYAFSEGDAVLVIRIPKR